MRLRTIGILDMKVVEQIIIPKEFVTVDIHIYIISHIQEHI